MTKMLLERLQRGDPEALRQAYAQFHGRLYSYLRRLARNPALADDLFQETWLKVARGVATLQPGTNLEAWLFTVARNTFLGHHRWRRRFDKYVAAFAAEPIDEAAAPRGLEETLQQLPETDRELLLLIADSELPLEAVAEVMGISYAALRQRLSRARAKLVTLLRQEVMA